MPSATIYADGSTTLSGSWTNAANAVGSGVATFASWTDATRRGSGSIQLNFSAALFAGIPDGSIINSIVVTVKGYVTNTTNIPTVTSEPLIAGVSQGVTTHAVSTVTTNVYAAINLGGGQDLATLKASGMSVKHTGTRANNTTSATLNLDYVQVVVNYTVPVPFAGWGIEM